MMSHNNGILWVQFTWSLGKNTSYIHNIFIIHLCFETFWKFLPNENPCFPRPYFSTCFFQWPRGLCLTTVRLEVLGGSSSHKSSSLVITGFNVTLMILGPTVKRGIIIHPPKQKMLYPKNSYKLECWILYPKKGMLYPKRNVISQKIGMLEIYNPNS